MSRGLVMRLLSICCTVLALAAAPASAVAQEPEAPGSLTVRLVDDQSGEPVAGAPVVIVNDDDPAIATEAYSTDAGLARLEVAPPGRYWIAAGNLAFADHHAYALEYYEDKQGAAYAQRDLVVVEPSTAVEVVMQLGPGGRITGTVRDAETGNPIAGAEVTSHAPGQYSSGLLVGVTDDGGRYATDSIGGLFGDHQLTFRADGYVEASSPLVTIALRQELEIDVELEPVAAPDSTTTSTSTTAAPVPSPPPPAPTLPRTGVAATWLAAVALLAVTGGALALRLSRTS